MDIILLLMQPIVLLAHHLQLFVLQQLSSKYACEDITLLQLLETKFLVLLAQQLTSLSIVTILLMLLHVHLDIVQLMEFAQLAHPMHKIVLDPPFSLVLHPITLLTILVLHAHQEHLHVLVQSHCPAYQDTDWSVDLVLLAHVELRLVHPHQSQLHVIQDSHYPQDLALVLQDILHQVHADHVLLAHQLVQLVHHHPFVPHAQLDILYQALDLAQFHVLPQVSLIPTDLVLLAHLTALLVIPLDVLPVVKETFITPLLTHFYSSCVQLLNYKSLT